MMFARTAFTNYTYIHVIIVNLLSHVVHMSMMVCSHVPYSIGPEGSAVCVYPAENSRETDAMASFNQGIFDIFREDLLTTDGVEKQNVYVEVWLFAWLRLPCNRPKYTFVYVHVSRPFN